MTKERTGIDSSVPAEVLCEVQNFAASHGASKAWLFGSAADPDELLTPNDWDFAILGVPSERWLELSVCLRQRFPNCKVESVFGYRVRWQTNDLDRDTPLHFVLGTPDIHRQMHPIFASIESGMCFYREA